MNESELLELIGDARVATLATIRTDGRVDLVPITFAFDDHVVVTAIDHKKKSTRFAKSFPNLTLNYSRQI